MRFTFDGSTLPSDPKEAARYIAESLRAALEVLNRRSLLEQFLDFFTFHVLELCQEAVFDRPRPVFERGAGLFKECLGPGKSRYRPAGDLGKI